jgi:chaperonin cofactor prefoldin
MSFLKELFSAKKSVSSPASVYLDNPMFRSNRDSLSEVVEPLSKIEKINSNPYIGFALESMADFCKNIAEDNLNESFNRIKDSSDSLERGVRKIKEKPEEFSKEIHDNLHYIQKTVVLSKRVYADMCGEEVSKGVER